MSNIGFGNNSNSSEYTPESVKFYLSSWEDSFVSFNNIINSVCVETEKTFIKLGTQLQQFQTKSKILSAKTNESVEQVSKEIIVDGICRITEILQSFENYLNQSNNRINSSKSELNSILSHVEFVYDNTHEFKRLIKSLRMLGFSTKMESVRLNQEDNSFEILANKVETLSDVIGEKIKTIKEKSTLAFNQINHSVTILDNLGGKQLTQSQYIIDNLNAAMKIFETQSTKCKEGSTEIVAKSEIIYRNISDVVTSIQFHDITRQQLEHVKEAFDEVMNRFNNINLSSHENMTDEFKSAVQFMQNVLNLQMAQLKHSENELSGAIIGIANNLRSIKGSISDIYQQTETLFEDGSSLGHQTFATAENELDIVTSYLIKNAGLGNELSESVKSVIVIIDELAEHIQDIEDIGSEIELIALNSSIKAAHTGSKGLALGVLAESIQKFSIDAKKQTKITTDILAEIEDVSNSLKMRVLEQSNQKIQDELVESNKHACDILRNIDKHTEETKKNTKEIKKDVNSFGNELSAVISEFTQSENLSKTINEVISEIYKNMNTVKENFNISPVYNEDINDLKNRYTMNSERDIHSKIHSDSDFGISDENVDNDEDTEFGNNVELF